MRIGLRVQTFSGELRTSVMYSWERSVVQFWHSSRLSQVFVPQGNQLVCLSFAKFRQSMNWRTGVDQIPPSPPQ